MNRLVAVFLVVVCVWSSGTVAQEERRHGEVDRTMSPWQVWNGDLGSWTSLEAFWLAQAAKNGGLSWGRGSDYPEYDQVQEYDTLIIELSSGPCMMEFFHSRWRRANDVRRWDPAFNDYGGCPDVFK
ncbi:hypothetical protein [Ferrimonas futtsuensis]|uniref:hypothetical protein n=1 Tax=Ferrimonas futtsuensis TaxID=364764 RepID=UPI0003FB4B70|nr:hypothetical protein [Ferrimonas futtsuensis]